MKNMDDLNEFFLSHDNGNYDRNNLDYYLEKTKFSYNIPSIHITGSNGKGSTLNFIKNIYMSKGYRVGIFVSPYVYKVNEMISINNSQISDEEYLRIFNEFEKDFLKYNLTSFEMQTLIALNFFLRSKIDIAIIEVGMGGRVDATNIFIPLLSIITSISMEHSYYLGRSESEIAYSKAGIIKPFVPVLVGKVSDDASKTIKQVAKEEKAPFYEVGEFFDERIKENKIFFNYRLYKELSLNTSAIYQIKNAVMAIEAVNILKDKFDIDENNIREGLNMPLFPLRYEKMKYNNVDFIIDGAHNPEAIENLLTSLELENKRPIHVIFAAFKDKNIEKMLSSLSRESKDIILTTFPHKRARTKDEYFLFLEEYPYNDNFKTVIEEMSESYPDDLILITGSLAFTALARKYLVGEE